MNNYYPMMVDLTKQRCLVVGGGRVAERKILALLHSRAEIYIVAPSVTQRLQRLINQGLVQWQQRKYCHSDGNGFFLIIAATDDSHTNRRVFREARRYRQWINVVDQPELCNFTVPSVVRRGRLQIAISTSGASPYLAQQLRQELEENYGDEYEMFLDLIQEMRGLVKQRVTDPVRRTLLMKQMISQKWVKLCRKDPTAARAVILEWLDRQMANAR